MSQTEIRHGGATIPAGKVAPPDQRGGCWSGHSPTRPAQEGRWAKMCPVAIDRLSFHALVDTGADASLISSAIFNQLSDSFRSPLEQHSVPRLSSVTGHQLATLGSTQLKLKIGNQIF